MNLDLRVANAICLCLAKNVLVNMYKISTAKSLTESEERERERRERRVSEKWRKIYYEDLILKLVKMLYVSLLLDGAKGEKTSIMFETFLFYKLICS